MATCNVQYNFAPLVIPPYTFYIEADDVTIDYITAAEVITATNRGNLIQMNITSPSVKIKIHGGSDPSSNIQPILSKNLLTHIQNFQSAQYNALLNGVSVNYISFQGFGASFTKGIITAITPMKGIKHPVYEDIYDAIELQFSVDERSWL